jgi:hypothetical protein
MIAWGLVTNWCCCHGGEVAGVRAADVNNEKVGDGGKMERGSDFEGKCAVSQPILLKSAFMF